MIPFTISEFLEVFQRYNGAVWPAQLALYGLAFLAIGLTFKTQSSKAISFILAALWLWMGVVYHFLFFSRINGAAFLFGPMFIAQSIVFIAVALEETVVFGFRFNVRGIIGSLLILYALFVYPLLGMSFGHTYPAAPTFGVPCPTTIFTFGIVIAACSKVPLYVLFIPLVWSGFGLWAALSLGMIEDLGLVIAGLTSIVTIGRHPRSQLRHSH